MADQPTLIMHHRACTTASTSTSTSRGVSPHAHTPSAVCGSPAPQNEVEASVQDFDRALALQPQLRPYLWQRGLSLYYLGEFQEAATQFRWGRLTVDRCASPGLQLNR